MTAVCAVVHDGKVHMGADSAGVGGLSLQVRADKKVFVNGPMVIGYTTSFRMGQLLRWKFAPPRHANGVSDERYMSTDFVDAVRACLKDGGFAKKENEVESGGNFLVGYRGQIWELGGDYQVGRALAPYNAVGCGYDLCLGALSATEEFDLDPDVRLMLALEAAQSFSAGVRAPFHVVREP